MTQSTLHSRRSEVTTVCSQSFLVQEGIRFNSISPYGQSWPFSFSKDGDKIAFAGFRDGYWKVWWYSLSTKEERQVTHYKKLNAFVRNTDWSPLGNQIVYEYAETTGDIWMVEVK